MMGYLYNSYGYGGGMMGYGLGLLGLLFCLVLFIDAILLGVWLWQNISKK
jgi:hypothetical protein